MWLWPFLPPSLLFAWTRSRSSSSSPASSCHQGLKEGLLLPVCPEIRGEVESLRRAPPRISFLHRIAVFRFELLSHSSLRIQTRFSGGSPPSRTLAPWLRRRGWEEVAESGISHTCPKNSWITPPSSPCFTGPACRRGVSRFGSRGLLRPFPRHGCVCRVSWSLRIRSDGGSRARGLLRAAGFLSP